MTSLVFLLSLLFRACGSSSVNKSMVVEEESMTIDPDYAVSLSFYLLTLAEKELGLNVMRDLVHSHSPASFISEELVERLSHSLHHKVRTYTRLLEDTSDFIRYFTEKVRGHDLTETLTRRFRNRSRDFIGISAQFFISRSGGSAIHRRIIKDSEPRTQNDELYFRQFYVSTLNPVTKFVLVVVDSQNDIYPVKNSADVENYAKFFVTSVLSSLTDRDSFGLLMTNDEYEDEWICRGLRKVKDSLKDSVLLKLSEGFLRKRIRNGTNLKSSSLTKRVFNVIRTTPLSNDSVVTVLYLKRRESPSLKVEEITKSDKQRIEVYTFNLEEDPDKDVIREIFFNDAKTDVRQIFPPRDGRVIFTQSVRNAYDIVGVIGIEVDERELFQDFYFFPNMKRTSVSILDSKSGLNLFTRRYIDLFDLRSKNGTIVTSDAVYTWKAVENTPYIVFIKQIRRRRRKEPNFDFYVQNYGNVDSNNEQTFNFYEHDHRQNLCRHFRYPATTEIGSLFLSPSTFKEPYRRFRQKLSVESIQEFKAYLRKLTDRNPGLNQGIREEVEILIKITDTWKIKATDSVLNNYIVRRYIATPSGILYVYPGISGIDHDQYSKPTAQEWFLNAIKFPGRVVLSGPRLDPGGAGYVITLSHTILSANDDVSMVMAMDLTAGYVYKTVMNAFPFCNDKSINCFLFEHRGYVLAHPQLMEQVTKHHLTHLEPAVMNELLLLNNFVTKRVCQDSSMTVRYYDFDVVNEHNIHKRRGCHELKISILPGTNSVLGIVNTTHCGEEDRLFISFCPCDIEGDRCLFCSGAPDQNECECPCQCPQSECLDGEDESTFDLCEPTPQEIDPSPVNWEYLSSLPDCLSTGCNTKLTPEDCMGLLGCSWCGKRWGVKNGESGHWVDLPEKEAFCGRLEECFGGKLGTVNPYYAVDSSSLTSRVMMDRLPTSPIGPIAGGIIGFFLLLSASVYCYRNHGNTGSATENTENGREVDGNRTEDVRRMSNDENYVIPPSSIEIVSPYRMNPSYRRPGTESDHGYSTMTQIGDDSEATASTSTRIRISTKRKNIREENEEESLTSSSSLLKNGHLNSNQFIVSATVHMVDTN